MSFLIILMVVPNKIQKSKATGTTPQAGKLRDVIFLQSLQLYGPQLEMYKIWIVTMY